VCFDIDCVVLNVVLLVIIKIGLYFLEGVFILLNMTDDKITRILLLN
jgi:hypothetical protein